MTSFQARILVLGGVGGICFLRLYRRWRLKGTDVFLLNCKEKRKRSIETSLLKGKRRPFHKTNIAGCVNLSFATNFWNTSNLLDEKGTH